MTQHCPLCAKAGYNHSEIVSRILSSPLDAGIILGGFTFLDNPFHRAVNEWFMTRLNSGRRRFVIMLPRNHGKTLLFGISLILWRLACDRNDRILYRMASTPNAQKTLKVVINALSTSDAIAHFFPDLVLNSGDASRWIVNQSTLQVPRSLNLREASVEVRSTTSLITGFHGNWLINDDLIDEVAVYSNIMQTKAINIIKNSDSMMSDQEKDRELIIGTLWAGQFYEWILEDSGIAQEFEIVSIGAEVDDRYREFLASIGKTTTAHDGDPVWPEKFTKATLEGIKRKDAWHYQSQWLNNRVSDEGLRFDPEDFRYYTLDGDLERITVSYGTRQEKYRVSKLQRILLVDPATGDAKRSDNSAIVVTAFDPESGKVFILSAWDGKVLPDKLINRILDTAERFKVNKILIEEVAFQKTLKHFVRQEMLRRGRHFTIKGVKPGSRSKGARIIDSLQPYVSNHQIHFLAQQRRIQFELETLQVVDGKVIGRSPNLVDALSYGVEEWRGTMKPRYMDDIEYLEDPDPNLIVPAYGLQCDT